MSESKSHARAGQAALLVFFIILAVVAAVFLNWSYIEPLLTGAPGIQLDFQTELIIIMAVFFAMLVLYLIFKARKPAITTGSIGA